MGRPVKNDRRTIVDAILFVASTGCQWRALPDRYPNWNTVHHYHLTWTRDGTWARVLTSLARRPRTELRTPVLGVSSTFAADDGSYRRDRARSSEWAPPRR